LAALDAGRRSRDGVLDDRQDPRDPRSHRPYSGICSCARAPKYYSRELVELIFTQPYCRIANVVESGIAQRQTASVYLKVLTEIGVVSELKVGREKLFIHPKFIGLLTSEEHSFDAYATKKRSRVR